LYISRRHLYLYNNNVHNNNVFRFSDVNYNCDSIGKIEKKPVQTVSRTLFQVQS